MKLEERARAVASQADLAEFISALAADLESKPESWENGELRPYLEAAGAWAASMHGYYQNMGLKMEEQSPWRLVADLLMAARIYE